MPEPTKIVREVKRQNKLLGNLTLRRGMKLWKWDAGTVTEVEFDGISLKINGGLKKKLIHETGCKYTTAINRKNAVRKLKKNGYPC